MIDGQMSRGFRGVRSEFERPLIGANREHKARPKGMGRTQQIAEIDGFGDSLHAYGEIAAGSRE